MMFSRNKLYGIASLMLAMLPLSYAAAEVLIKDREHSFTHRYEFMLSNNQIFLKEKGKLRSDWIALEDFDKQKGAYQKMSNKKIREISADGDNLIAITDDGNVYYTKTYSWNWDPHWGFFRRAPLHVSDDAKQIAMSHSGDYMRYYRDQTGFKHSNLIGVTTVFRLSQNGTEFTYADPMLNHRFDYRLSTPRKSRFVVESFSASGSTLMVINKCGEIATTTYDFDIGGENPLLIYRYNRNGLLNHRQKEKIRSFRVRVLPAGQWQFHAPVPGAVTSQITLFQNGNQGERGFTMRVVGKKGEDWGIFYKDIQNKTWSFKKDPDFAHRKANFLINSQAKTCDLQEQPLEFNSTWQGAKIKLRDFKLTHDRHQLQVGYLGQTYLLDLFLTRIYPHKNGWKAKAHILRNSKIPVQVFSRIFGTRGYESRWRLKMNNKDGQEKVILKHPIHGRISFSNDQNFTYN